MTKAFQEQKRTIEKMDKRMETMQTNLTTCIDLAVNKFYKQIQEQSQ